MEINEKQNETLEFLLKENRNRISTVQMHQKKKIKNKTRLYSKMHQKLEKTIFHYTKNYITKKKCGRF